MSTPPSSADSIEAIARRLAQWIKYSWDGLGSGSIVDRGYPEWDGHAYQGGQDDLRRLAAELVSLSAPAQAATKSIDEIAAEITEEIKAEALARQRVFKAADVSGDVYLLKMLLAANDSQKAALLEYEALSAQPQEAGMIRDALVAAQAHLLKYTGGFAANQEEASLFGKIAAAVALSRPQSEGK